MIAESRHVLALGHLRSGDYEISKHWFQTALESWELADQLGHIGRLEAMLDFTRLLVWQCAYDEAEVWCFSGLREAS